MGQGPSNHFDAVVEHAGLPGDYLYRSYSVDHFNLGMWGIFRVKPEDSDFCAAGDQTAEAPASQESASEAPASAEKDFATMTSTGMGISPPRSNWSQVTNTSFVI